MKRQYRYCLILFLCFVMLWCPIHFHSAQADADEKVIRVGWFYQPGYQQFDRKGNPSGFNFEFLMDIAKYTGWTYEFVTTGETGEELTWQDSLSMLQRGKLDLMGCLLRSEERQNVLSFSALSAGQTITSLFVRSDSPITGTNVSQLNGITVAAACATLNDDALVIYSEETGFTIDSFVDCNTISAVKQAVVDGSVDAGVLGSFQPDGNTRIVASFAPSPFYFATTKGNTEVLNALNQAMNTILVADPYYAQTLSAKYNQTSIGKVPFSDQETAYLAQSKVIRVCFSDALFPMIQTDKKTGEISGVIPDILNNVSQATGVRFTYRHAASQAEALRWVFSGDCDIIAGLRYDVSLEYNYQIRLTDPYLTLPLIRVSNASQQSDVSRIGSILGLSDYVEVMQDSDAKYIDYDTALDCFEALRADQVDEIIINSDAANYFLAHARYSQFISTGLQGVSSNICMGVSKQIADSKTLLSILSKALGSISNSQINDYLLSSILKNNNTLEMVINRIPITTAVFIILLLILSIVALALFSYGYLHKSRLTNQLVERTNQLLLMDDLTGLYNQSGFMLTAQETLRTHQDQKWFILDFDVDGFEHFNALYGFEQGNALLCTMAQISKNNLTNEGEICARIHADHFVCLLAGERLQQIYQRTLRANQQLLDADIHKGCLLSYGIYEIDDPTLPLSVLCDRAQAAKRTIKGNYENIVGIFNSELHHKQLEDAELVKNMDTCLQAGEFVAYYQPKFDIHTEQIVGAEALVRWRHGEELIQPDRFIGLFENNGLISRLDFYMLDTVCRKLRRQIDTGCHVLPISLNFSRNHLYDETFLGTVLQIVQHHQVPSELILIEFTETVCLESIQNLKRVVDGIHSIGMRASIDDFGSGYSSLNMLKDLNFDEIKLDRGFLSATGDVDRCNLVIKAVLTLAGQLGFNTVAEGVETESQLAFLRDNGCDVAQGFYFSQAVPGDAYDRLFERQNAIQ